MLVEPYATIAAVFIGLFVLLSIAMHLITLLIGAIDLIRIAWDRPSSRMLVRAGYVAWLLGPIGLWAGILTFSAVLLPTIWILDSWNPSFYSLPDYMGEPEYFVFGRDVPPLGFAAAATTINGLAWYLSRRRAIQYLSSIPERSLQADKWPPIHMVLISITNMLVSGIIFVWLAALGLAEQGN